MAAALRQSIDDPMFDPEALITSERDGTNWDANESLPKDLDFVNNMINNVVFQKIPPDNVVYQPTSETNNVAYQRASPENYVVNNVSVNNSVNNVVYQQTSQANKNLLTPPAERLCRQHLPRTSRRVYNIGKENRTGGQRGLPSRPHKKMPGPLVQHQVMIGRSQTKPAVQHQYMHNHAEGYVPNCETIYNNINVNINTQTCMSNFQQLPLHESQNWNNSFGHSVHVEDPTGICVSSPESVRGA